MKEMPPIELYIKGDPNPKTVQEIIEFLNSSKSNKDKETA